MLVFSFLVHQQKSKFFSADKNVCNELMALSRLKSLTYQTSLYVFDNGITSVYLSRNRKCVHFSS